jgi:hypothetical protein
MKSSFIAQKAIMDKAGYGHGRKPFEPYSIPTGEERGREVGVQSVTEALAFDSRAKLEERMLSAW